MAGEPPAEDPLRGGVSRVRRVWGEDKERTSFRAYAAATPERAAATYKPTSLERRMVSRRAGAGWQALSLRIRISVSCHLYR